MQNIRLYFKSTHSGSSRCGSAETYLTSIHEDVGSIPGLTQWGQGSGIAVSSGVGYRRSSDPALLWLWRRLSTTAPIPLLALELPYTAASALKKAKINNKNKINK